MGFFLFTQDMIPTFYSRNFRILEREPACKPGSVENDHSSRTRVATHLKQPTRRPCGPQVVAEATCLPIWSCSRWGLPCHHCYQWCGALLPHHFTLTIQRRTIEFGGMFSVALSVGSRLPGVTWHPALWSPDFPLSLAGQRSFGRLPGATIILIPDLRNQKIQNH